MISACSKIGVQWARHAVVAGVGVLFASYLAERLMLSGRLEHLKEFLCFSIVRLAKRYERRCRPKRIFVVRHGESEGNVDKSLFECKPDNEHSLTEKGRRQAREAGMLLKSIIGDEAVYFQVSPYRRTRETLKEIISCFIDIETECNCSAASRKGGSQSENQNQCISDFHRMNCNPAGRAAGLSVDDGGEEDCGGELGKLSSEDRGASTCYLRCRSNSLQSLFSSYNDVYVWPRSAMYKVREDARLREQDFGNYQDLLHMQKSLQDRQTYGPFWYRFEHGESGGDVWDRISGWWASVFRDMARYRYPNYVIVTHGITMRLFCMYYFKWSVEEFSQVRNPSNCEVWELRRDANFQYRLVSPVKLHNGQIIPEHMTVPVDSLC
uniref:Uncharacterized protein n=1 Tax=Guillardia theta TaxID=55529 RepID=A0A7S4J7C4_GUITH|mmetsp:Transcript_13772/g.47674  ORF Transcript_13772/g.47674 Transcript_13772/m.47674 type:complete len:381 (+) Transcript_13772:163-1305(+)